MILIILFMFVSKLCNSTLKLVIKMRAKLRFFFETDNL